MILKVLFDDQIFSSHVYGGISRYFAQILKQFKKENFCDFNLSLFYSENDYIRQAAFTKHFSFLRNKKCKGSHRILSYLKKTNRWKSIWDVTRKRFDLFHPTYYDPYFLAYLGKKPFVLTIHDMIHELYAGTYFNKHDITIKRKQVLAKKAAHIIAVSEQTKKDVIHLYGIEAEKISVVYHANSLDNKKAESIKVPTKYLLFVGGRKQYKNFNFFVESVASVFIRDDDLALVCVGGGPCDMREHTLLERLGIREKVFFYSVSDTQLAFLYEHALCFVFPSLYEGFGIPIIEAFSCHCPVVLSNTSCFPEVAQDAALYFDPTNQLSIETAINRIIDDVYLRKRLILRGIKRAQDFSWKYAAYRTKQVYESIL